MAKQIGKINDAAVQLNLGVNALNNGKLIDAEKFLRRAIKANPQYAVAYCELGTVLMGQERFDEADAAFQTALSHAPNSAIIRANYAHLLLKMGRYKEGWTMYESRHSPDVTAFTSVIVPPCPFPYWKGESLEGKSLLIWPEQGLGDSIQLARYFSLLKSRGLKYLSVATWTPLVPLFSAMENVDNCIELKGKISVDPHHFWCFSMCLPRLCDTTLDNLPNQTPYIHAPADRVNEWKSHLPAGRPKIGLVWAGNPSLGVNYGRGTDHLRSLKLRNYLPLLKIPGLSFVSLQKDEPARSQIRNLPDKFKIFDPMGEVNDFVDTAAIIENLDLVITVDTAIAHLAGAMNKPVWILSRVNGCWRWLTEREDSPWYPTARIFRQRKQGVWDDVIEKVAANLKAYADEFAAGVAEFTRTEHKK